jgi:Holliday junction resolvase RusA-like endonuclease
MGRPMRGFEDVPGDWAPATVWFDGDGNRQQSVQFIVPGRPVPKGNLIKGRYGGYHDPTIGIDDWVNMIRHQANSAMRGRFRERTFEAMKFVNRQGFQALNVYELKNVGEKTSLVIFTGAVKVDAIFVLPRPKATPKKKTPPAIKKPDSDKLARAVLDGMTGVVYVDDSQVVDVHSRKRLADIDETVGCQILVTSEVDVF